MKLEAGTVMFAGWEEHLPLAIEYAKNNNLTVNEVKIVKRDDQVYVIAKVDIYFD